MTETRSEGARPDYRALAVEDDADTLTLMRMALGNLPLTITHAPTGAEAIDFLQREIPDLLFLDINLPDMHGWEVLNHFRADQRLKQMHVIVLTSHREPVHRLIGMLQPVAAYLSKPVAPKALLDEVRQVLHL